MPVVPGNTVLGNDQEPQGPAPEQPSQMYMLMAAAAMRDMGRLYAPMEIPVPTILAQARKEYHEQAFGSSKDNERGQEALSHAEKNNIKPDEVFEHGGESWVHGNGAIDRASEEQIKEHSTNKLRRK